MQRSEDREETSATGVGVGIIGVGIGERAGGARVDTVGREQSLHRQHDGAMARSKQTYATQTHPPNAPDEHALAHRERENRRSTTRALPPPSLEHPARERQAAPCVVPPPLSIPRRRGRPCLGGSSCTSTSRMASWVRLFASRGAWSPSRARPSLSPSPRLSVGPRVGRGNRHPMVLVLALAQCALAPHEPRKREKPFRAPRLTDAAVPRPPPPKNQNQKQRRSCAATRSAACSRRSTTTT